MLNGTQCRICKKALCALHGIGRGKLAYICEQVATGQHTAKPDQRRRHLNRPHKPSDKWIDFVKQHISSFPAEMSHYSHSKNIAMKLGAGVIHNLLGFYSLTGCDTTSSFCAISKTSCWKKYAECPELLEGIGRDGNSEGVKLYLCRPYCNSDNY